MKTHFILAAACSVFLTVGGSAQSNCANDLNGFVAYKNVGGYSSYGLSSIGGSSESKAAQTYNYSGPGKIMGVRVYGQYPFAMGGVPLRIGLYDVDGSGKPLSMLTSVNRNWYSWPDNGAGYVEVFFPTGVPVSNRFAVSVEIRSFVSPYGASFSLQYTGNSDGGGQDLASLAGNSTGNTWASAMTTFSVNGDFRIIPIMEHQNSPSFLTASSCYASGATVTFSNTSQFTRDSMFNKIGLGGYAGLNKFYKWDFGDGGQSNLANPTHVYTTGGLFVTTLTTTIEGWTGICTRTYSASISVGLIAQTPTVTNAICFGSATGSVVVGGQFGAAPYTYNLNGGFYQSSATFNNLVSSVYTVNVKDNKGCTGTTTFNLFQPVAITFNAVSTTNSTCGNANGSLFTSSSGGVTPVQYSLDNGALKSTATFTGLTSGTHTLVVTDASGCSSSTLLAVNDIAGPLIGTPNITNVSCFGGNDGSITLSSSGGTGLIQYSINGGNTFQASGVFTGVAAGTYNCVVKDNAACLSSTSAMVTQGQALVAAVSASAALCNGASNGQISASSTGGTGFHNYSINGINYQSGQNFTGLAAGVYTVYVKDVTSCVKTITTQVTQPAVVALGLTSSAALCNGSSNGSISAVGTGGNGSFSYNLNGSAFQSSGSFMNLPSGTYSVGVKDINNCVAYNVISVTQPAPITTTVNTTNSTCTFTNGSILILAGGGSGSGYQYSINNGLSFSPSGSFSPLTAGTYFIIVKDGTNCQQYESVTVFDSNGPTITASSQQNVSCNGGNDGVIAVTTVTGGTGALQYSRNGINWQISPVFQGLSAGVYVVQVRDVNMCTGVETRTITQPNAFLIVSNTSNISCYGYATGAATIAASGGAGFLAYSINGGATFQSGTTFNSLPAGTYTLTVKDAAMCTGTSYFTIVQPAEIKITALGILNVTCNGANNGAINLTASGGVGSYQYSMNGTTFSPIGTFNGLSGNNYFVYVKDANNCVVVDNVTVLEPAPLVVTPFINNVTCAGGNNGAINVNVVGGTMPYMYQWSNGASLPSIFNLTAGTYSLLLTDFNGCLSLNTYTLIQPQNPLVLNGLVTPASGGGTADGTIDITINGGVGPYTFIWSNGATTEDVSGLNPGSYMVTIIDANGCTTSMTFNVENATGLTGVQITTAMVKLYPNPANDFMSVEANGYRIDRIEVINLIGQNVISSEVASSSAKINVSELTNGTYFVKVTVGNSSVIKKINIAK